jgi:hypothetical protein
MPRIILSCIAVALLGTVGAAIYRRLHQDSPTAAPDLTLLNENLHRSMESELGAPLLTANLIELTVSQQDLDSELERLKNLASKLGGTGTVNNLSAEADRELFFEIPQVYAKQFIEAVQDRTKLVLEAPVTSVDKKQIVEVKLHATK